MTPLVPGNNVAMTLDEIRDGKPRADRERLREWLNRGLTPRPIAWPDDQRWWANRKRLWWDWFGDFNLYLGTRSARTGPDDVNAAQRCDCPVCLGTVGE